MATLYCCQHLLLSFASLCKILGWWLCCSSVWFPFMPTTHLVQLQRLQNRLKDGLGCASFNLSVRLLLWIQHYSDSCSLWSRNGVPCEEIQEMHSWLPIVYTYPFSTSILNQTTFLQSHSGVILHNIGIILLKMAKTLIPYNQNLISLHIFKSQSPWTAYDATN